MIRGLRRREADRLPDEVRARVTGRPLAWAAASDGTWVVGTRDRLHLVGADEARSWGWEQVHRAEWDQDTATLAVEPVTAYATPVERHLLTLPEPGDLVPLVRERVTATVVLQRRVPVTRSRGFQVIGRRPPGGGEVVWAFELDEGLDPADPVVAEATAEALADAKSAVGLC